MAESPDEVYERVLAEEKDKGSSPPVAEARAKAARHRARKGLPTDPAEAAKAEAAAKPASDQASAGEQEPKAEEAAETTEEKPAEAPSEEKPAAAVAKTPAAQAAPAAQAEGAPKGRGAAARAARSAAGGQIAPERMQRLLAVVKPEAIQRVEREPIDRVNTWPHLMAAEAVALLAVTVFLMLFSAFINAPFREMANINQTPNPSKAPWYFLGLQELLRYFHPQVAGVLIPQWLIVGFFATPYIDRNPSNKPNDRKLAIVMFTIYLMFFAVLTIVGSLFRGPGFNWIYPWQIPIVRIFEF
ncbi:MAG: menaquinol-cytochrome c reductase cytochrome b subunit [Actinobacteria bacterium]|nr:menaquinol-cytochrome c reductase cytochrome b subunit [Actinomycetota bacterium]